MAMFITFLVARFTRNTFFVGSLIEFIVADSFNQKNKFFL